MDYPTQFRVNDALDAVVEMGGTVVRTFGAESVGCAKCIQPTLGVFNETALVALDYVIKACKDRGLRLVLPLVDDYAFYVGGTSTYTTWRSLGSSDLFYTDATVISDFKLHVSTLLNRLNTLTGIVYKNDPTIMAWETGNELHLVGGTFPPTSWTQTIADYIKSIDKRHMVIDGEYVSNVTINSSALSINSVDVYTNHHYPMNVTNLNNDIFRVTSVGKAFYVGEYAWEGTSPDTLASFLSAIEAGTVAGDTFWSLFPHLDTNGYVVHADGHTLFYPGLEASPGFTGMRAKAQALRTHAYAMRSLSAPADGVPGAPLVTSVNGATKAVSWRGAAIADTYTVERATAGSSGPFTVVCNQCATDNQTPWTDSGATSGNVWYRVKGHNLSGVAGSYSPVFAATIN